MEDLLTFEKLLELPDLVLKISNSDENNFLSLLSDAKCDLYYYSGIKRDLKIFFNKFNDAKFSYNMSFVPQIKATKYEISTNQRTNKVIDSVSDYVTEKIKEEQYAEKVYNQILNLAHKLTKQEAVYFVQSFFANKSDEYICEILQISRNGIQRIRKSCLVKMYLEFLYKY